MRCKRIFIALFSLVYISFLIGCRALQITKFSNIQRFRHIKKSEYNKDTLHFNNAMFLTVGYDGGKKFYDKGDFFIDTLINFDTLTQSLFKSINSLGLPINNNIEIQNKVFGKITTKRNEYNYNIIRDESIVRFTDSIKNRSYVVPVVISYSRIYRGDFGIQQTVDLYIKVCVIRNRKMIYSKFFMTFKNSDIFTLDDAKDYESTREFFELNNHTPVFTQEDWNRIMAFAMKGYLKRLKK